MSWLDCEHRAAMAVEVVKVFAARDAKLTPDEGAAYTAALKVLAEYLGAPPTAKRPAAGPDPRSAATLLRA